MKRFGNAIARNIDARDVASLVGLGLVAGGLWFVWPPLAAIVPGALIVYVTMLRVA